VWESPLGRRAESGKFGLTYIQSQRLEKYQRQAAEKITGPGRGLEKCYCSKEAVLEALPRSTGYEQNARLLPTQPAGP